MDIYYCEQTDGFYMSGVHSVIPEQAIKIAEYQYKELLTGISEGKTICVSNNEVYLESPKIDEGNLERVWRNTEISLTDRVFVADYGPVGWTTEDRQTAHAIITEYRKQLKLWPDHPEFPNSEHRPVWPESVPRPAV